MTDQETKSDNSDLKPHSPAVIWDRDCECPQCQSFAEILYYMECCGLVMCDSCKETHDVKKGYSPSLSPRTHLGRTV